MKLGIYSVALSVPFLVFAQPRWEARMNGLPAGGSNTVSMVDSINVWIAGGSGSIWKSSNAGNLWAPAAALPSGGGSASVIAATSPREAMCATEQGKIFRTTDGGVTWMKVFDDTTVTTFFNDLEMFDHLTGYAIGDPPQASDPQTAGICEDNRRWADLDGREHKPATWGSSISWQDGFH